MEDSNKDLGDVFQEIVADYISKTCDINHDKIVVKSNRGYDIVANGHPVEVKGISSLNREIKSNSSRNYKDKRRYSRFTIDKRTFPMDVEAVAFVLKDKILLEEPVVIFVYPKPLLEFINRTTAVKVSVPLLEVKRWIEKGNKFPIQIFRTKGEK